MESENAGPDGPLKYDRILVVEDNAVIAMNTEALLEELGVTQVATASSVAAALELIEAHQFDLAILDLNLGHETSIPLAQRLQGTDVALIFSTGYGDHIQLPGDLGSVPVLKKPYSLADLERLVLGA